MIRTCGNCRVVIRLHSFANSGRDYCSKACLCLGMGHKASKAECCVRCRGPVVKVAAPAVQEVMRSNKKVAKAMKRRKSQRPVITGSRM